MLHDPEACAIQQCDRCFDYRMGVQTGRRESRADTIQRLQSLMTHGEVEDLDYILDEVEDWLNALGHTQRISWRDLG